MRGGDWVLDLIDAKGWGWNRLLIEMLVLWKSTKSSMNEISEDPKKPVAGPHGPRVG